MYLCMYVMYGMVWYGWMYVCMYILIYTYMYMYILIFTYYTYTHKLHIYIYAQLVKLTHFETVVFWGCLGILSYAEAR